MSSQQFDLVIVGGGLVGAGLALALSQTLDALHAESKNSLRIALIDARKPCANDPRLFALNYSSCQFLTNLGLWDALAEHAAPIHQVHVSAKNRFGSVKLDRSDAELAYLGYVIPAYILETALNAALAQASESRVTLFRPAQVTAIQQHADNATLTVTANNEILQLTSKIIIGADGTVSTVREQAGITTQVTDYQQSALVTRTQLQRSHHHIAYERFNEHGAIAMLPLPNHECATIWTADQKTIADLHALSDNNFLQKLQQTFGYRNGRLLKVSQRHTFPLRMIRADKMHDQHIILIGNAAHTLHPIAAQGFNLAVYEIAVLADYINHASSPITATDLANALQKATAQQSASMQVSHYLSDAFMEGSALSSLGLHIGMAGLDNCLALKQKFIARMTGRTGRIPRLLLNAIP